MSFSIVNSASRCKRARVWAGAFLITAALGVPLYAQDKPAAAPTTASASAADEVYFGPKFQKDRVVVYKFQADNSSIQTQNDQDMVDSTYTESIMRFTVDDVHEDGSAELTMTYDRIFTQGDAFFGGRYVFDSTQDQQDPETDARIIDALRQLANSTVKFHAGADGNVEASSVTGTEAACEAMKEVVALQNRVGEFNSQGLGDLFESTWRVGNETYTKDISKPWQDVQKTPVEGMGTWTFTSDYQLLDQDEQQVVLGMKMLMELEFQPPDERIEGTLKILSTKFDMIKGDWRYVWDKENSELIERSGELEFRWVIEQEGIFEGDVVRTDQHQHVVSSIRRVDE